MSKRANILRNEIAEVTRKLIEIKLCVGWNFPDVRKAQGHYQVGLMNDGNFSIALRKQSRQKIHETLIKENLFSMILNDDSIIQMSYLLDNQDLIAHRLTYIPKPYSLGETDVVREYGGKFTNKPMLRFDFSSLMHEDHYHSYSHLHIGTTEDCRVPVSSPLGPNLFIYFLLRNYYSSEGKNYFEKYKYESGELFSKTIVACEEQEIHINFPSLK